jgi:hypothetical protein
MLHSVQLLGGQNVKEVEGEKGKKKIYLSVERKTKRPV